MLKQFKCKGTVAAMWGGWPQNFSKSYKDMMAYSRRYLLAPGEEIKEVDASVSWHESARNELVEKTEGDWLFSLDTDHVFAPDLLERLLREMRLSGADVVSGLYLNKSPNTGHCPVAVKDGKVLNSWPKGTRHLPVDLVGGGCLLVKSFVFKKIRKELDQNPFDLIQGMSEDYSFCKRCEMLGIPIILCPQIECHHTVPHLLSAKDFNFEKE